MIRLQKIQEAFKPGNLPEVTQKVVNILSKRLKTKIGLSPFVAYNFKPETGGSFVGYKACVNNGKGIGFFYDSSNNLSLLAVYKEFMDNDADGYVLLQGYNIVQVLDELVEILQFYFDNGYLPTEGDLNESIFQKAILSEARPSKADGIFKQWFKQQPGGEELITNERLSTVYRDRFEPWADQNNIYLNTVSFYKAAKAYMASKGLQNRFARKTITLNKKGQSVEIDTTKPKERIEFERIKAEKGYEDKFMQLKMNLKMVFKGVRQSLYAFGTPGIGKTASVETWCREFSGLSDYLIISQGVINSTKDFVDILDKYRDGYVLVFDDLDDLLKRKNRGILLNIMDAGKPVRKVIMGKEQLEFTSRVVFLSNQALVDPALASRAMTIPLILNQEERLGKILSLLKKLMPKIPMDIKRHVYDLLIDNLDSLDDLDLRKFETAVSQYIGAIEAGVENLADIWVVRSLKRN